jgi:hypothetical protein
VKCRFPLFLLLILLAVAPSAWADDATKKSAKQPIGVFTWDDGDKVLVGVGTTKPLATLDVTRGEVKIGSTGAPCTATLGGTLRYAESKLQFCDGTGWRNVSLDKAQ